MTERSDQVDKLLGILSRHSDLLSQALDGSVSGGDRQRNAGIEALFTVGALKPFDEDTYRLNPRLREFFADYFASYNAFQALRRFTGTLHQAQEQWLELRRLKAYGSTRDQDRLFGALEESIVEIAYAIEHNLLMLHSLLATQYGNVEDLESKFRQNRYYARQVALFLRDVEGIDAFVERTADEATANGMQGVRLLVTRRLGAKRLAWTSQIKDAQAVISKRLFEAKLMESKLKLLSRYSLWLTRHRNSDGWELPLTDDVPVSLLRPEPIAIRPQPDVADTDPLIRERLLEAISKLPPRKDRATAPEEQSLQLVADDDAPFIEPDDPLKRHTLMLVQEASHRDAPISLLEWKKSHAELDQIGDEAWLLFACMQLRGEGLSMSFRSAGYQDPFDLNECFHDIEVSKSSLSPA